MKMIKFVLLFFTLLASDHLFATRYEVLNTVNSKSFSKWGAILQNSTWVVPPQSLSAAQYISGTTNIVTDQTIWVINSFNQGYFFGDSYTAINGSPTSHKKIVGSVTPLAKIYISFYPTTGTLLDTDVVMGIGEITKINGKFILQMQMNTAQNNTQGLSHWSYMVSVDSSNPYYQSLPSVNMSVPQFISLFQ